MKDNNLGKSLNTLNTTINATSIHSFKHKGFIIEGSFVTGSIHTFYLENQNTKERIVLNDFSINKSLNQFKIDVSLEDKNFFEGNWNLYCEINLGQLVQIAPVLYSNSLNNIYRNYVDYNESLYYFDVYKNKLAHVSVSLYRSRERFITSNINNINLVDNSLVIEGSYSFNLMADKDDMVTDLVFIHRRLNKKVTVPLQIIENQLFKIKLPIKEIDTIVEENGIWDANFALKVKGINKVEKIDMQAAFIEEVFTGTSKPIYSRNDTIRTIRPFITMHRNLAFYVDENIFTCDIPKISYQPEKIIINGFVFNKDIPFSPISIYLENKKSDIKIECPTLFSIKEDTHYFETTVDLEQIPLNEIIESNLYFSLFVRIKGKDYSFQLVSNYDDIEEKSKAMIYPPLYVNKNGYPLKVVPYYMSNNALAVSFTNSLKAYCNTVENNSNMIRLEIEAYCEGPIENIFDPELVFNGISSGKSMTFPLTRSDNNSNTYACEIGKDSLRQINIDQESWNVIFSAKINNCYVQTSLFCEETSIINKYSTFRSNTLEVDKNLYFSIFFNKKSKKMESEIREPKAFEKKAEKIRFFIAKGIAKLIRPFIKKPIWLIGENLGEVAQDNGFAFFLYCVENKKSERYYYVSKENNKNADNLIPFQDNVLKYDSFRHLLLYWLSQYLIVSHGIRDVIPSVIHNKMGKNPKSVIYLQHGIIAMKKLSFSRKSYNGKIKKFVVSSVQERDILINKMNFKPKQIMITGLARFDSLVDNAPKIGTKEILLMPTWRDWVVDSEKSFLESDFYHQYKEFLNDASLHNLLEKNNLILKFFPHIEIQKKYINYFSLLHERIKIVKVGEESIKDLIQNSNLMITDYSSVAFDFNYLRKPVIFFQFDVEEYLKYRGSYVDLSKDLYGDVVYTKDELLMCLTEYINEEFHYKQSNIAKSKQFYAYNDRNNSERIYWEIKRLSTKDM